MDGPLEHNVTVVDPEFLTGQGQEFYQVSWKSSLQSTS